MLFLQRVSRGVGSVVSRYQAPGDCVSALCEAEDVGKLGMCYLNNAFEDYIDAFLRSYVCFSSLDLCGCIVRFIGVGWVRGSAMVREVREVSRPALLVAPCEFNYYLALRRLDYTRFWETRMTT